MGKERVPRRPMAQLERARADALLFLRLDGKAGTFAAVMAKRAKEPEPTITEREAIALARLCCLLRLRLEACGDGKLVPDTIISELPPDDGREWESQCARCGSSTTSMDCDACGGEGETAPGELYEQDPLWYDEDDADPCSTCGGRGHWLVCLSSEEWCKATPRPGREDVAQGTVEWFVVQRAAGAA